MNKYSYFPNKVIGSGRQVPILQVNEVLVPIIAVEDHLDKIMEMISLGLNKYAADKLTALDFSSLRERGSKTSHTGISTGAASFAKMFSDLAGTINNSKIKPIVILRDDHKDFPEYAKLSSDTVIFLRRNNIWEEVSEITSKKKPNWELTREELRKENERRCREASPWYA